MGKSIGMMLILAVAVSLLVSTGLLNCVSAPATERQEEYAAGNTVYALSVPAVAHPLPTPTPEVGQEAFPTPLVAVASGISVAVVGLGLLVYFKKRKH